MKMNYRARNKRRIPRFAAAIVVLVGLFAIFQIFFPGIIGRGLHTLFSPVWSGGVLVHGLVSDTQALIQDRRSLADENERLRRALAEARVQSVAVEALETENRELKALLGRTTATSSDMIAAVLRRPPSTAYDTLIIDLGEADGVTSDDYVLGSGRVALGRVRQAHARSSIVEVFSSPGVETDVLIGPARVPVRAVGVGGGELRAEVPRDASVATGDAVVVPGFDQRVFALVAAIEESATDAFTTVRFSVPLNIYELMWVLVSSHADSDTF